MNKKDITEKIIIALTAGENLSTIFLKVQLLASLLGNDELVYGSETSNMVILTASLFLNIENLEEALLRRIF